MWDMLLLSVVPAVLAVGVLLLLWRRTGEQLVDALRPQQTLVQAIAAHSCRGCYSAQATRQFAALVEQSLQGVLSVPGKSDTHSRAPQPLNAVPLWQTDSGRGTALQQLLEALSALVPAGEPGAVETAHDLLTVCLAIANALPADSPARTAIFHQAQIVAGLFEAELKTRCDWVAPGDPFQEKLHVSAFEQKVDKDKCNVVLVHSLPLGVVPDGAVGHASVKGIVDLERDPGPASGRPPRRAAYTPGLFAATALAAGVLLCWLIGFGTWHAGSDRQLEARAHSAESRLTEFESKLGSLERELGAAKTENAHVQKTATNFARTVNSALRGTGQKDQTRVRREKLGEVQDDHIPQGEGLDKLRRLLEGTSRSADLFFVALETVYPEKHLRRSIEEALLCNERELRVADDSWQTAFEFDLGFVSLRDKDKETKWLQDNLLGTWGELEVFKLQTQGEKKAIQLLSIPGARTELAVRLAHARDAFPFVDKAEFEKKKGKNKESYEQLLKSDKAAVERLFSVPEQQMEDDKQVAALRSKFSPIALGIVIKKADGK